MKLQYELPATACAFNLYCERTEDGERVERERRQAERDRREAQAYQEKMQEVFEFCPGFTGGEMPTGPGGQGHVLIESHCAGPAMDWLKRRFLVKREAGIETTGELRIDFATKRKRTAGVKHHRSPFMQIEQFSLPI